MFDVVLLSLIKSDLLYFYSQLDKSVQSAAHKTTLKTQNQRALGLKPAVSSSKWFVQFYTELLS